mmetsp:Transcript_1694/g.5870  ORF Transcript_1694/g.5870 Transcript_1694/m.5870 type:complete len:155 (+) Transcript_1694:2668-3132(+)
MNSVFLAKEGGLFDFDLTLPLVIGEFCLLYLFLQQFLFKPILSTIENRREFINEISLEISTITSQTEQLTLMYDSFLSSAKANLRQDSIQFTQKCDTLFNEAISKIIDKNQSFLNTFSLAMIYSTPIRAKNVAAYPFEDETMLIQQALMPQLKD